MDTEQFRLFFDRCVGSWVTERTYHYLKRAEVERSHTEFVVQPISADLKTKVLEDNLYSIPANLDELPGYHLKFETVSDKGEEVSQQLNLLFVPTKQKESILHGDYLRDRAYEEDRPIISAFQFDPETRELLMTTNYTHVVAVDSITMVNPDLRIRKILSYARPPENEPLEKVVLVGFGVEQKQ
ncbi:MAG: phycobiliprotein lyase [Cyanobacteriota bacterium]|nr:phycobiliprotein lyase [Cyanobacteriota bacterium]